MPCPRLIFAPGARCSKNFSRQTRLNFPIFFNPIRGCNQDHAPISRLMFTRINACRAGQTNGESVRSFAARGLRCRLGGRVAYGASASEFEAARGMVQKRPSSGNTRVLQPGSDRARVVAGLCEAGRCRIARASASSSAGATGEEPQGHPRR